MWLILRAIGSDKKGEMYYDEMFAIVKYLVLSDFLIHGNRNFELSLRIMIMLMAVCLKLHKYVVHEYGLCLCRGYIFTSSFYFKCFKCLNVFNNCNDRTPMSMKS